MKKFDNNVTKLQREMIDITNNLNKFRNKNHKTISLIINNLNVLSNEIAYNNNFGYDTNISNKNSQNENSKTSIDLNKEIKNGEEVLCKELEGYAAYMKKVKYRLIPYVW